MRYIPHIHIVYIDQKLEDLPENTQKDLKSLDIQLTELFEQLHAMVVHDSFSYGHMNQNGGPMSSKSSPGRSNFLFSVLIVTNATISHIQSTFEKFLPKLTNFFEQRDVKLPELVCSARDLWSEEFPFEHFYDFWKAWTLEEILRELHSDGFDKMTVFSTLR